MKTPLYQTAPPQHLIYPLIPSLFLTPSRPPYNPSVAERRKPTQPMTPTKLNAAIIIVSTTASKDPPSDVSGNLLTESFTANSTAESTTWQVVARGIVPDDREQIQGAPKTPLESPNKLNLIVTTGGTGFAITDVTPEVGDLISALL